MAIDQTLSSYSDWTYGGAAGVYVLAMLLYLVEQSFGLRAKAIDRAKAERALAGVGARDGDLADEPPAESAESTVAPDGRAERFGRMAVALTVLGAGLHLASLALRAAATSRAPWGNMYEYGSAVCLVAVVTWLVLIRRFPVRRLGVFVLLPVVILMFLGGVVFYADAAPVQPALRSYWLVVHVILIASGSGMLLVPGVASVLYLVKVHRPQLVTRLPEADVIDRIAYRTTIFAFPIYTIGIICGAIWAEEAWGRFWGWDPKETVAFVAWVVYAGYLHSRATAGWRGGRAAAINIVAFVLMIFNLFFINLVVSGLHSYAGT